MQVLTEMTKRGVQHCNTRSIPFVGALRTFKKKGAYITVEWLCEISENWCKRRWK